MKDLDSLELEESILGVILSNPKMIENLLIDERTFNNSKTIKTLELLKKQYEEFKTIDLVGLISNYPNYFSGNNALSMEYLVGLLENGVPSQFEYYQDSIFKLKLKKILINQIDKFEHNQITQDELLDSIHDIEQRKLNFNYKNLNGEQIYKLISQQNKRITFKYEKLTKYSNIQEHDLIVLAARPGVGKTGFACNLLESLSNKYKCIYFNMEMTEQQLYRRLVSINCKIPISKHDNIKDFNDISRLQMACNNIAKKKIEIITGGQTIRTIRSKIIKESNNEHVVVFIDYVGLIRDTEKNRSSYERVTEIVKELRQISLDYNCTIFVLAQINRNSEKEKDKYPKISDLKESGELEQSATTVLMLHNENLYKTTENRTTEIKLIIGKNRNGGTGIIDFDYYPETQNFAERNN